jgi:hypothetical protein
MVMPRLLSCASVFRAFTPPPPLLLFTLHLPRGLAAAALLGVVNTDVLLLRRERGSWTIHTVHGSVCSVRGRTGMGSPF